MKNFALFILGIIIGALAVYVYGNFKEDYPLAVEAPVKPYGLISPNEAKALGQAYDERYKIINDSLFKDAKTEDNRSSWYKLEDIEAYLTYAKQEAKTNGYTLNGLRLYLGAYPDEDGKKGLTTLFFIPTGFKTVSEGSFLSLQDKDHDIPSSHGLNFGNGGVPPSANYPQ